MHQTLASIEELLRMPAPGPLPMGIACDGPNIWVSSFESDRIYGMNAQQGTVFEEAQVPGATPFGLCVTGDAIRAVCSDDDGNRTIRRYIMGKDFKSEIIRCPDDTGSYIAYDGDRLYLSQRDNKKILELDEAGAVLRSIDVPALTTGMVVVGGRFYLATTQDRESTDYRLACLDARKEQPEYHELAVIPFATRGLGFDGTRFWTTHRESNTIIAFARPD